MSTAKPKKPAPSAELMFAQYVANARAAQDGGVRFAADGGVLHEWRGTHWQPLTDSEAEREAWNWLVSEAQHRATAKAACACVAAAALAALCLPERTQTPGLVMIPCKNGYLTLRATGKPGGIDGGELWERTLEQPKRDAGMTYVLACDYSPKAKAPEFERFIEQVLPDVEVRAYVQEYLGYTLLPDTRFQRAQFWLGGGANGKSTLAEIVAALHEKVAAMELDALDGFKLVNLLGSSLVYVDETPQRIDEQRLKILISGGLVQVDRKFRDPINLRPTAKWIILGNQLPAVSDQSAGFWRRLAIIPFTASFPDGSADPLIAHRIIEKELSGVLNWALGGLHRLLERGRFTKMPEAVMSQIETGKRETNSVLAWFVNSDIETDTETKTPKDAVYASYRDWCRDNGSQAVSSERFWKRLAVVANTEFPERKAFVDGKRVRVVPIRLQAAPAMGSSYASASGN